MRWMARFWVGVLVAARALSQQPGPLPEPLLKARCIGFIAGFTLYPPSSPQVAPISIGLLGSPNFEEHFREVFPPERTILGRRVRLEYPKTEAEAKMLKVLFIGRSEEARLSEILHWVKGRPVLTIGDTPGFAEKGVMVNIILEKQLIRLEVNLQASREAGLDFQSTFLKYSRIISRN